MGDQQYRIVCGICATDNIPLALVKIFNFAGKGFAPCPPIFNVERRVMAPTVLR